MRCENAGADYDEGGIQWTCKADVPEYFKLGSTDVLCEGYESSKDPYILKGSCGVEYRLLLTERGEQKFGYSYSTSTHESSATFNAFFWLLFAGVVLWIIWVAARNMRNQPNQPRRPFWGNGGGGGWGPGGPDDAPPPYSPFPPRKRSSHQARPAAANDPGFFAGVGRGWRPGFWTGAAGGGLAGYMAGRSGRNQQDGRRRYDDFGAGSNHAGPSNAGSSSNSSPGRYTSTGFGETRNR
jgi:store-operated calcium entry-associated regulatory factor